MIHAIIIFHMFRIIFVLLSFPSQFLHIKSSHQYSFGYDREYKKKSYPRVFEDKIYNGYEMNIVNEYIYG